MMVRIGRLPEPRGTIGRLPESRRARPARCPARRPTPPTSAAPIRPLELDTSHDDATPRYLWGKAPGGSAWAMDATLPGVLSIGPWRWEPLRRHVLPIRVLSTMRAVTGSSGWWVTSWPRVPCAW